jgi:hypothetical protein
LFSKVIVLASIPTSSAPFSLASSPAFAVGGVLYAILTGVR